METTTQPTIQREKPKGRYSPPKDPDRRKDPERRLTGKAAPIAYVLEDKAYGKIEVLNSSRAWWLDRSKVERIFEAYKIDANDEEACSYAGITLAQLRGFKETHPQFHQAKLACQQVLGLRAKKAIADKIEQNPEWYLERKRKDEYSTRVEQTGANGRSLYDGLAQQYENLVNNVEQHTRTPDTGHPNAGPDGHGDDASPTDATPEAESGTTELR